MEVYVSLEEPIILEGDLPETIIKDVYNSFDSKSGKFSRFWQVTFKITDACGMRCKFCSQYAARDAVDMPAKFLKELVSLISQDSLACGFLLTGGEPLFHKDIKEVLDIFKTSPIPFDVNTSFVSSADNIRLLLLAKPRTIRFSMHANNAEENLAFSQTKSWGTLIKHADFVSNGELRPHRVEVNTHISAQNYHGIMKNLEWISSNFSVDDINLFPVYDLKEMQLNSFQAEEYYKDVLPRIITFADQKRFQGLKARAIRLLGDITQYADGVPTYVVHQVNCFAGRSIIYIDNFQNAYPCASQQIHRSYDGGKCLGRINDASDFIKIREITDEKGFDPNKYDVCQKHCPLFFSMVNGYVAKKI